MTKMSLKKTAEVYSKTSELGRIGMTAVEAPQELDTAKKEMCPAHTPLKTKQTSMGALGLIYVRFDRKTLPKAGKSRYRSTWREEKTFGVLVWDYETRALMGVMKNWSEKKADEWIKKFEEMKNEQFYTDTDRRIQRE